MSQNIAAVRSLVVPLEQANILLPGSVVAEVVPYSEPLPPPSGAPAWLIGIAVWREQRIPLVSLDTFMSGDVAPPSSRARVAVLKGLSGQLPFYGIVTKQIPHLTNVEPASLAAGDDSERAGVAAEVLLNGDPVIIPDLDAIEAALREALPRR
jgi:chemosensory pili system protein ChpC